MASLLRPLNTIDAAEVNEALAQTRLGGRVLHLPSVESTNDLALAAAQAGATFGAWVADEQTAGRGRGGHTWHSAPGDGLYLTALFTPHLPASALNLSLAAGLAAWNAIREVSGIVADIRWPNDLVTRNHSSIPAPGRKLGGVLVETAVKPTPAGRPAMLRYSVIGIGLNVAHARLPPELADAATSLHLEGWQQPDRQPLLIALLRHLDDSIRDLEQGMDIFAKLAAASTWLRGKRVSVPEDGGYTGTTAGLDDSGFLLVDTGEGQRTVRSGGVREL